jgi:type II secretory pathway component GspD/PulD (secretin)
MKRIFLCLILLCIAAVLIPSSQAQAKLERTTTIDVSAVTPHDVYGSLSKLLGLELAIAPEIQKPVTMHLENVTVHTALTALSENLGCQWSISGNTLHVQPAGTGKPGWVGIIVDGSGQGTGVGSGTGAGIGSGRGTGVGSGTGVGIGPGRVAVVSPGRGVAGSFDYKNDYKQMMACRTPSGFRFNDASLSSVTDALGKACNMNIRVNESDKASKVTIDLSDLKILSALKALSEQTRLQKPIMILMGNPPKKASE